MLKKKMVLTDKQYNDIVDRYLFNEYGKKFDDKEFGLSADGNHYIVVNGKIHIFVEDNLESNIMVISDGVYKDISEQVVEMENEAIFKPEFFEGTIEYLPYPKPLDNNEDIKNENNTRIKEQEDYENIDKNQLEAEIDGLNIELENLKREKEQKYEELKSSEYDEELNKEIKELEEKVKQKQDEINNKESLLTKYTTNNKIDDLKYNINEPETNEPVTESVEDFKEDNFENEDYWKFLNLIKNYFVSKSGYTFVDSIKNVEETSESTLLIFSNTYEYEGKKEVEIVTVYVVDDVNDDPDDEKFVFVLERSFNINDYVNTEEEMTLDDNEKIKRIILMGTNVKNFDEQTDKVFKVSHNEISNFDGDSLIGLKQIELNHTDLSPKNKEQDLPDEDKEVLIEEQDDKESLTESTMENYLKESKYYKDLNNLLEI